MAHWQDRPEAKWKRFAFNQPYAKGVARLRDEVLAKTDFDPATLFQWGTMQAMAVIEVLKECERRFGAEGQRTVYAALRRVGLDVGRQILRDIELPEDLTSAEFVSFYATVINRIAYASLEQPRIDGEERASFDILWCPHQDHYEAFDCRVQRYFVQGMIDAATELAERLEFEVRFDSTIPAGAETCHFSMWSGEAGEAGAWQAYTERLNEKALEIARSTPADGERGPGEPSDAS